ncbi:MAG: LamG-like jellyroll fold domain-containing protein [Velocimicrobium sp.]
MEKVKTKQLFTKATAIALAATLSIGSVPFTSYAKVGSALDVGHPTFKNTELLDQVYNVSPDDYTADSQLMKIYNEDLLAGSNSFYIDRILKREGVANGDAGNNGNDDGNTFMTRGRALYMYTSNPDVIGFGGNTAYHQPMGNGDMYGVTFSQEDSELKTSETSSKRVNMPSHWLSEYTISDTGITADVQKFINYQNVAVTLITLKNSEENDKNLKVSVHSNFAKEASFVEVNGSQMAQLSGSSNTPSNLTVVKPKLSAEASNQSFEADGETLSKTITIPANGSVEVKAIMAFTSKEIPEAQEEYLRFLGMDSNAKALMAQKREYNLWWAETMPYIDVPNKAIQKAIDYRWWLENFNKLDANIPGYDYQYPVTIEGVLGYNNAIVLTQPMHLQDTKWMRDASLAYGQLLSVGNSSQSSAFLDNPGNRSNWNNHYGQYLGTAGLEAYKVIGGNKSLAETLAYYFEHDAKGQIDHYGNHVSATTPANKLIDYSSAFMTGNDADTISFAYPNAGRWRTHAENAYVYGSANAAADLYNLAGDVQKSTELSDLSSEIQNDILSLLWCDKDKSFETRAVDPDPNFVSHNEDQPNLIPYKESNNFNYFSEGVVPTDAASIAKYGQMLEYLSYADEFPLFPYYTANQQDNKKQAGSNNFSNINFTVQARAYEAALRTYDKQQNYVSDDMLSLMVEWCAWNMYPNGGDIRYPNNNEFYNVDNKTNDTYYRSWIYHNILGNYNYIFVEDVAGIVPREDTKLELDPIEFDYDHFMINNVKYHGDNVTVVWDDPTDSTDYYGSAIADGFSVYKNGDNLFTLNKKAHVVYENGVLSFPDGEPSGLQTTYGQNEEFTNAMDVVLSDNVSQILKKSGIETNITSENLAKGKTVTASFTPDKAREASWANKHRADGTDSTSKAVNEEKPDPQAITDGVTVNMPFWGNNGSSNASDCVVVDLENATTMDMMNLYFYNDRQQGGYAEPAKYTLEYWDGAEWKQVEDQTRTPSVPQANYNTNYFKSVTTDKVRITVFNAENHDTAITEVQLYQEGGVRDVVENKAPSVSISQDMQKSENMKVTLSATCEDDGMPWDKTISYHWDVIGKPEGATTIFSNENALNTTLAASIQGEYTVRFTATDGELSASKEMKVNIAETAIVGSEDIALKATPSSDYTAGWENLNGINNENFEPVASNGGTNKGWGNWQGKDAGASCYVAYTWNEKVEISGCGIFWYDDGGGTRVPASISFQYKDDNGEWKDATMLTSYNDANKIDTYNTIALESIETTELRLNMVTQAAATGIYRFKVYSTPIKELLPVFLGTKQGVIPELPGSIYGRLEDGSLLKASVVWDQITQEQVANNGEFTVNGVNTGTGKFVTATVYVRSDMDMAGITEVKDTQVSVSRGKEVVLPDCVKVQYNNGAYDNVVSSVIWDSISKEQYEESGVHTYPAVGTVSGTAIKANLIINVLANTEQLQSEIEKAEAIEKSAYTKASYLALEEALIKARQILQGTSDETMINAAVQALQLAREGLVRVADVAALTKNIARGEALNSQGYTAESFEHLTAILNMAKDSVKSDFESQEKIDLANEMLMKAFDNLIKSKKAEKNLYLTMDMVSSDQTKIMDRSKNGYEIKADGAKGSDFVAGIKGNALALGEHTSFKIPAGKELASKSISISYWVKRTGMLEGNNNILWAKKESSYNGNGFYVNYPVAEKYSSFFVMDGFNGFYVNEDPNEFLPENEWTNVVITWDDDVKRGAIYKNGEKQSITYIGDPESITGDVNASNVFGENGYPGSGYPAGMLMDEFSIYNDRLSSDEIQSMYKEFTQVEGSAPAMNQTVDNMTGGVLSESKKTQKDSKTGEAITVINMSGQDKETQSKITATVLKNAKDEISSVSAKLEVTPKVDDKNKNELRIETKDEFIESLEKLATKENPLKLKVVMDNEKLINACKNIKEGEKIKLEYRLPASVFNNEKVSVSWIKLSKDVLKNMPNQKDALSVVVSDYEGNTQYEWNIGRTQDNDTKKTPKSMNLAVTITSTKGHEAKDILSKVSNGCIVSLKQKGNLPTGTTLSVPILKTGDFKAGSKVYVYRYIAKKNKITRFDKTVYTCKKDGSIELNTKIGSRYLVVPKKISFVK